MPTARETATTIRIFRLGWTSNTLGKKGEKTLKTGDPSKKINEEQPPNSDPHRPPLKFTRFGLVVGSQENKVGHALLLSELSFSPPPPFFHFFRFFFRAIVANDSEVFGEQHSSGIDPSRTPLGPPRTIHTSWGTC